MSKSVSYRSCYSKISGLASHLWKQTVKFDCHARAIANQRSFKVILRIKLVHSHVLMKTTSLIGSNRFLFLLSPESVSGVLDLL